MLNPYPLKAGARRPEVAKSFNKTMRPGIKSVDIEYPWAPVLIPEYTVGVHGRWEVRRTREVVAPGYYLPREKSPAGYALWRKERGRFPKGPWMSFTAMERQSHMPHIYSAHGNCVVAGLGMGMYLYNIIQKKEVHTVTVFEKDQQVIDLFMSVADPVNKWGVWWDKVDIVCADIFDVGTGKKHNVYDVDHLYIDIWQKVFDDRAYFESAKIFDAIQPKHIGWWTMEGDFAEWALKNTTGSFSRERFDAIYRDWAAEIKMPVICQDVEHMGSLSCAVMSSGMATMLQKKDPYKAGQLTLRTMYLLGAYKGVVPDVR